MFDQPVDAKGNATMRRRSNLKGIQQKAKFFPALFLTHANILQHGLLNIMLVNT